MTDLLETIVAIENAEEIASITKAVRQAARPLGYDRYILFSASPLRDELIDKIYWVEGDWFGDQTDVDAETYVRRCPVTRHILDGDEPFFWTKTTSQRGEQYKVVKAPKGSGVHGLQVPVFGHAGLTGAISFGGETIDSSARARLVLTAIGAAAFRSAHRLLEGEPAELPAGLSPREREVLRWIAAGRRQADIAVTLGLSERTVENHLRRVRRRLGVATTAQAVRVAIRAGEIEE